jgi:lambda repressor-like predicted transcriptional regulator
MCLDQNAKPTQDQAVTSRYFAWEDAHMTDDLPPQRPEGALIQASLKRDGRSIRQLATLAGISDGRWRQVMKGHLTGGGHVQEVIAPAATLARMAAVLGISAEDLERVGRKDAADLLDKFAGVGARPSPPRTDGPLADEIDLIYASNMTARQKLERIRMVLTLRAQAEAEEAELRTVRTLSTSEEVEQRS